MAEQTNGNESEIELTHLLDVLLRRRWISAAVLSTVVAVTALYSLSVRPVYQSTSLLVIEKESGGATLYVNGMIENSNEDYYQTQYRLLKSESLLWKLYDELKLSAAQDFAQPHGLDKLSAAITISPILRSRLVNIKVKSHNPELATRIANELARLFVEQNLNNQLFISKEVLHALQMQSGFPEARRLQESLPAVVNNPLIQKMKADYAKLQAEYADVTRRYTEKHPIVSSLKSNMAALEREIQTETDKIVQSLKTELSGQLKGNNVRVVDPAKVPEEPIQPRKLQNLAVGFVLGMVLAVLAALLVESLDQSIRSQEDVETRLRQPFLGTIPNSPSNADAPVFQSLLVEETSVASESIRNLRPMIDFAGIDGRSKQFLVTSAVKDEGKSYVSSNLAVAFAQLGEKVLLVDGDFRRPRLHKNFMLSSEHGLSDFLAAGLSADEVEGLLLRPAVANLHVLACGVRPPNPSELLNTPRLAAFVNWAKARFDRVVIDCTPMFPIHDTLLWARHVRSAVLVVRYGKTRAPLIRNSCGRLQSSGAKLLGVVVNAARFGSLSYAAYGYSHQQYYHGYAETLESSQKT